MNRGVAIHAYGRGYTCIWAWLYKHNSLCELVHWPRQNTAERSPLSYRAVRVMYACVLETM